MKEIKNLDELKEFFNETISTAVDKLLKDRTYFNFYSKDKVRNYRNIF